jgi:hypothetical protein
MHTTALQQKNSDALHTTAHLRFEADGAAWLQLAPQPLQRLTVHQHLPQRQPQRSRARCCISILTHIAVIFAVAVDVAVICAALLAWTLLEPKEDAVLLRQLDLRSRQHVLLQQETQKYHQQRQQHEHQQERTAAVQPQTAGMLTLSCTIHASWFTLGSTCRSGCC